MYINYKIYHKDEMDSTYSEEELWIFSVGNTKANNNFKYLFIIIYKKKIFPVPIPGLFIPRWFYDMAANHAGLKIYLGSITWSLSVHNQSPQHDLNIILTVNELLKFISISLVCSVIVIGRFLLLLIFLNYRSLLFVAPEESIGT